MTGTDERAAGSGQSRAETTGADAGGTGGVRGGETDETVGLADPTEERSNCGVGGIVDLDGGPSHETLDDALTLLANMEHRGAKGAEPDTGDGAGVMLERPDGLFREVLDSSLPETYAVGTLFLPPNDDVRERVRTVVARELDERDCRVVTWRRVPTDADRAELGETARASEPDIWQFFVARASEAHDATASDGDGATASDDGTTTSDDGTTTSDDGTTTSDDGTTTSDDGTTTGDDGEDDAVTEPVDTAAFDHDLYVARRAIEAAIDPDSDAYALDEVGADTDRRPYVVNLDRRRVVYKGLLTAQQLRDYFPDLRDERVTSRVALVHARFSTNTLGAWHLAHPYRNVVHNGEFNTVDGNVSWMRAREADLDGGGFTDEELDTITPVVSDPDQSDTATVDETLDLLLQGGRDLPHALRMLVPEAYRNDPEMSAARRDFYDYHASLVEPWDGPALVIGFDGDRVAGVLDRNGLRPCRYDVTTAGRLIVASEAGALETPPEEIEDRGRLRPGQVFVADPDEGRVVPDEEVFADLTDDKYGEWVESEAFELAEVRDAAAAAAEQTGSDVTADGGSVAPNTASGADSAAEPDAVSEAETVPDLPTPGTSFGEETGAFPDDLRQRQVAAGYSHDQLNTMLEPMIHDGKDPVGSMGDDTPPSVLADTQRSLFDYFVQGFAQVSNPPIDYIREDMVTTLETRLGPQRNLLDETPEHARQVVCDSPVLTDDEAEAIQRLGEATDGDLAAETLDTTFPVGRGDDGALADSESSADTGSESSADTDSESSADTDSESSADVDGGSPASAGDRVEAAVASLRERAAAAVRGGADVLVLSDRGVSEDRAAIPAMLATAAVHTHLVEEGLRARCGLVVQSAHAREVHHFACLVGYGAGAVHPYLAYDSVRELVAGDDGAPPAEALSAYRGAVEDGLSKTMARMGISALASYQGAAVFSAVGLNSAFLTEYFTDTESKTEGIGIDEIGTDVFDRHVDAYDSDPSLPRTGEHSYRNGGERHGWNPESVSTLHEAVRNGDREAWDEYTEAVDGGDHPESIRDTFAFDSDRDPVPLSEVEPVEEIVERFSTAAMSLGSLSPEAHETNAKAMNRIGGKSNTGEGGEPPERFGTERECSVKQVASGRFGVTTEYLASAEEIQIKMAQGSKPGEGGHLPGKKVNELIAHVRCSTPGVGLISPPPQHDIYSIEDLKQLIHDLKAVNPDADVNVKLVAGSGIGTIAAGVAKANADAVHISGHSGGTGASPRTSIKHAGLPWELGLAEANQMLRQTGLRDRIRVSTDGGMMTGRDVAVGVLLGAEEFAFGTASLVSSGCVMARQCHQNTCPVGVATQREDLRERFPGEPDHVINFMLFVAQQLREIMAEMGFRSVDEMVGRPDCLTRKEDLPGRADTLDPSAVLADPADGPRTKQRPQRSAAGERLDDDLLADVGDEIEAGESVKLQPQVTNADRAVGATISKRVVDAHGGDGLPDDTVELDFEGAAGQSFGAFLAPGVTARVTGTANDYVGKGLSGGTVVVRTPADAGYDPTENVVIGNVALYGATDGEAYIEGVAGERFAVRNSGVKAVVESVGDHGCEYMTGGVVAVLGEVGRNFAAGMSGGVAYVYDPDGTAEGRVNRSMVSTSRSLTSDDRAMLRRLVENHAARTDSDRAAELLADWETVVDDFLRVLPDPYADVLEAGKAEDVRAELPGRVSERSDVTTPGVVSDD